MNEYLFVYSDKDGSYPVRFRILKEGEDPNVPDLSELTGTVNKAEVGKLTTALIQQYPAPEFRVSTSWANKWMAIQRNYRGLDYEYD